MTPTQFPHLQFLEKNKALIAGHFLPEMLQKRILGFEELKQDLEHITDEDRDEHINKMERLSYELDEDLEEYFEEYLENNDYDDEPDSRETNSDTRSEVTQSPASTPQQTIAHSLKREEQPLDEKVMNREPAPKPPEPLTDEGIIEQATKDRMKRIHPDELFKRGFKGPLGSRMVLVGKYCLRRGKYDIYYDISQRGE